MLSRFYAPSFEEDAGHYEKNAFSNIPKILPPKNEDFQMKNSDIVITLLKTEIAYTH